MQLHARAQLLIRDDLFYPLQQYMSSEEDENVDPRILFDKWATKTTFRQNNWNITAFNWNKLYWEANGVVTKYLLKFININIVNRPETFALFINYIDFHKIEIYGSLINYDNFKDYINV